MVSKLLQEIYHKLPDQHKRRAKRYYSYYRYLRYVKWRIAWFPRNLSVSWMRRRMGSAAITDLNRFEQKIYSQNGEDGIIRTIFDKIGTTNKYCVEFGVEDGSECNTRYLIEKYGWEYLHMDCREGLPDSIKKEIVTAENINSLFNKYNVPPEFDLISIDVDSNDYWLWKGLKGYSPRVVVIEYNASIPPTESRTIKYDVDMHGDGTNYFGASLLALVKLGKKKGYTLVGCDNRGINAFFVRDDLIGNNFVVRRIEETYKPPKYGKKVNGRHIGHPPSEKLMIFV